MLTTPTHTPLLRLPRYTARQRGQLRTLTAWLENQPITLHRLNIALVEKHHILNNTSTLDYTPETGNTTPTVSPNSYQTGTISTILQAARNQNKPFTLKDITRATQLGTTTVKTNLKILTRIGVITPPTITNTGKNNSKALTYTLQTTRATC